MKLARIRRTRSMEPAEEDAKGRWNRKRKNLMEAKALHSSALQSQWCPFS